MPSDVLEVLQTPLSFNLQQLNEVVSIIVRIL